MIFVQLVGMWGNVGECLGALIDAPSFNRNCLCYTSHLAKLVEALQTLRQAPDEL